MWEQGQGAEDGVQANAVCSYLEAAHVQQARAAGKDSVRACGEKR